MTRYNYIRDPAEIYRRSFAEIRAVTDLSGLPAAMVDVAVRLVHTCGEPDILQHLAFSDGAAEAGHDAVAVGEPILADAEMVAAGINRPRLTGGNQVICTLHDERVPALAEKMGTTRSAAAIDLWRPVLDGAVVVIGNAPTALFRLLEIIQDEAVRPALIIGMPVGFIGAAESKQALIDFGAVPFITLRGRRGGSALAAAALNALAATVHERRAHERGGASHDGDRA